MSECKQCGNRVCGGCDMTPQPPAQDAELMQLECMDCGAPYHADSDCEPDAELITRLRGHAKAHKVDWSSTNFVSDLCDSAADRIAALSAELDQFIGIAKDERARAESAEARLAAAEADAERYRFLRPMIEVDRYGARIHFGVPGATTVNAFEAAIDAARAKVTPAA